jgi:hypothetical protein
MESAGSSYCEACAAHVTPHRPSRLWHGGTVLVWLFIIVAGPFLAIMPPLNLVTIPIFVFVASALVGYVSEKTKKPPACPRCGRDVDRFLRTPAPSAAATEVARRSSRPADESLVEGALIREAELVSELRE